MITEKLHKISFDYDSTLSLKSVQRFAKQLVDEGHDVWVVTTRTATEDALSRGHNWMEEINKKLFSVADECGIKKENIVFTDHKDKIHFLEGKEFLFHLDDDIHELIEIMQSSENCKPVNVGSFEWEEICIEYLKA